MIYNLTHDSVADFVMAAFTSTLVRLNSNPRSPSLKPLTLDARWQNEFCLTVRALNSLKLTYDWRKDENILKKNATDKWSSLSQDKQKQFINRAKEERLLYYTGESSYETSLSENAYI